MSIPLRQSTAVTVRIGPYISQADGFTAKTGLVLATLKTNTKISLNNAASQAITSAAAFTEDVNGYYIATLDATTDTNTLGRLRLTSIDGTNYLPMWEEFQVYPQAVYDALFAGSGNGILANVATILGTASAGAAGYVAPDWGHINAPTTTVDLSGTTIKNVDNAIASVTTVTGNVTGNVTGSVGSVVGNVGGNLVGSIGGLVTQAKTDVADAVLNAVAASYNVAGSIGALINLVSGISVTGIPAAVWNYLVSNLGATTTVGGWFNSLLVGIKAKTDTITNGVVPAVVSPYNASSQTLTLYYRDTYGGAQSGRPILIPVSDSYDLTDPNIDVINLSFKPNPGHPGQTPVLEVASVSVIAHQATFALTSADMTILTPGANWRWDMQITYKNGDKATPVGGKVAMSGDVTP